MSDQHEYLEHQKTYDGFITLTKWSTVAVVLLLVLMAVFLL
ncbi:MAG: aa3-type cytochrome c oxidase subunit IV [Alphaproteobacteria bacterium]|nr:aa3-type cytochrome c oxidase subunit IV [Alphaproteobacteria bacterium]